MSTVGNNIPEKTIERLSEYRRTLLACHKQGITHIFSHVLAGMHGITAVQVRRDLMLIGFSSDTKKGYDVKVLIEFIKRHSRQRVRHERRRHRNGQPRPGRQELLCLQRSRQMELLVSCTRRLLLYYGQHHRRMVERTMD